VIAEATDDGELRMQISADLFDLVAEHIDDDDLAAVCLFLEKLPLRKVLRLELLATVDPEFALEYIGRQGN
jgi:hypothetical protein